MNPNIAARLTRQAEVHPTKAAIVAWRHGRRQAVSYQELAERVSATAAGLSGRGVSAGDRVLLFVPMSIDLYVALLAVLHLGGEAVFVDAWATAARVNAAIRAADPRAWIGTPMAQLLRLRSAALRRIPISVVAGRGWSLRRLEDREHQRDASPVTPDTVALVTFTTGSTGPPKAAARSHDFLWAQHETLAAHLGLTGSDIDMPTLPVFVLNNLALGITSVLPDFDPRKPSQFDPAAVLTQMRTEQVTTLVASPAFCDRLVVEVLRRGEELPLRRLFTGGAPVLPPLLRNLSRVMPQGAEVIYGSTEAEPISGIAVADMLASQRQRTVDDPIRRARTSGDGCDEGLCVGYPVQGITVRIIRPFEGPIRVSGSDWSPWDLESGATGEIIVSGRHVLTGYLDDPAADAAHKIHDGDRIWHRTGDAGYRDSRGRLWLMGRVQRRIERDGQTWWPLPAELRAFEVDGIEHAACITLPPDDRALLCVELATGGERTVAERALRAALHPWPVDRIVFLSHIPRDPRHQSKTDHAALLTLLSNAAGAG